MTHSRVRAIERLKKIEDSRKIADSGSWHEQYKDSSYIYIGGLSYDMTEGDIRIVFSQYGNLEDINLVRDKETGKSRGFAFLKYLDQRSTILAVDNLNGIELAKRTIQVDHVLKYRSPEEIRKERESRGKQKTRYADMVTDEIFRSAAGEYFIKPASNAILAQSYDVKGSISDTSEENVNSVGQTRVRRPRTEMERNLKKRFKKGALSESEYLTEKKRLKRELKVQNR